MLGVWGLGASLVYAGDDPGDPGVDRPGSVEHVSAAGPGTQAAGVGSAPHPVERHALQPMSSGARTSRPYPFDGLSRVVAAGRVACPEIALGEFAGERVALSPPARAAAPFRERLRALEQVVVERSLEVYGRLPSAILVAASYDCRSVSGRNQRLSEHALGNAIDIRGFRFEALDGAPPFEVHIDEHWRASGENARHARFLRGVADTLLRREVFRTLLGPAQPDHADHFHFDMAPHPYVNL